ncbi:MAG: ferredoxin:protochlorophyllide reductase (ATP-dependent) subunit B [Myxococcaceae bacterium]|jgi:light-independent protochlorophyllide reductase subunit B|nr:ferredoxin:protochlorophyllide reductase (ATP-dependent) subunit B [Myxococcaceae bacterium]MCA3012397.1 ferredoxin:protochlorophyllide reductase (ATP-dependent) subunit B [Myxococcaceae bacterium]
MQLTVWTYEGPPHVGAMRVATAMRGVHYVLHAPQGDTYADLLFTMIERNPARPPVTYTTFQARDLGKDTAELFKKSAREAYERFKPELVLVGASCTAELIQDDPAGIGQTIGIPVPVVPVEFSAYQHKENHGASETFYRLARACTGNGAPRSGAPADPKTCNVLGPTALGFRHRDDVTEVCRLLAQLGVKVNVVAPLGASPGDLARLPDAAFNVVLYPELAETTARWLQKTYGQPMVSVVPIGVGATKDFVTRVATLAGVDPAPALSGMGSRLPWYSRSVDSTYLTGKRVFIFGDASHVVAAARVASEELGFTVVGLGTYSRELARDVRAAAQKYGVPALISDDHLEVEETIAALHPELVLGTQMERHIAKRLGLPCAVISAPVHVQDYPARYSPQMGFEGANVLFDTWVHPLMMGLEEHLLSMFREDFEFADGAGPSHLGAHAPKGAVTRGESSPHAGEVRAAAAPAALAPPGQVAPTLLGTAHVEASEGAGSEPAAITSPAQPSAPPKQEPPAGATVSTWTVEAEKELKKIPFFVRGKAKRNTERFAQERNIALITLETLYDAKAHFRS